MMSTQFSLAPLFRHTVGFDRFNELLDTALRADQSSSYPPYDILREGEDSYRVVMAVAGFTQDDLQITAKENLLTVTGRQNEEKPVPGGEGASVTWLHRGIARRSFERNFRLADHVQVEGASLRDGLLEIHLRRVLPEASRPREIQITH
ncbi:Hsp20 family protein [Alcanivorax sp. CY1518]|uniref:Hsp20 family protein n=2 Tax=Alcanivorax quisquiliarum TaxID=2933565 RepID=A0ABT0E4A5_9GAMM|nr:Hsp20 family protein [Alcanivorax quisquiliarum]